MPKETWPEDIGQELENAYLGGNRRQDRNLRSSVAADFGPGLDPCTSLFRRLWIPRAAGRCWRSSLPRSSCSASMPLSSTLRFRPSRSSCDASAAQVEAVIAIYLIAYATLVVTGGRLGDIYGTRNVFLAGVLGFTLTSLWCGLARSGPELIAARLAQGATAALMVPQVLATLHLLFSDASRGRAFGIYGVVLGLAGAAGFLLGGVLVTLDLAGLGWRTVFFVNVPFGLVIIGGGIDDHAAGAAPRRHAARSSRCGRPVRGLVVSDRAAAVRARCALGAVGLAGDGGGRRHHRRLPAARATPSRGGGMPLIDLALLSDCGVHARPCAPPSFSSSPTCRSIWS